MLFCKEAYARKSEEVNAMEYLILVAVVSVMALYALIIVGCLKQPEW
jgi:F0F1-type ATP synthase membrane subunit c/vacuolar-type H+-ATPase subunit K